jgi:hypothetical protein
MARSSGDMSGLAQTIALAQAGLQAANQGAISDASQAGTNFANVLALQGKALDAFIALASLFTRVPALRPPGAENISTAGGAVNLGKDLDANPSGPSGSSTGQAPNSTPFDLGGGGAEGPSGSSQGAAAVPGSDGSIFASTAGSMAGAAFDALIGRSILGRVTTPTPTTPPVSTARPLPATVTQAIGEFRSRSGTSPFTLGPNSAAIRDAFATRLADLAADPKKFDQSHLMACGMAAFFHVWLKRDPLAAVNYAIDLFEHGRARIGSLQINPNQQLLQEDYSKLVADFGSRASPLVALDSHGQTISICRMPDIAEWIMMSSLRNATPARLSVFSYLGRPAPRKTDSGTLRARTQEAEGVVFPDELATWLAATGKYSDVVNKANAVIPQDFSVSQNLFPDNNRDVVMLMHTQMLNVGFPGDDLRPADPCNQTSSDLGEILLAIVIPNHYVVLEDHIDPPVDGKLSLTFWCWADSIRSCMPYKIDLDTFNANFFGAVIAVK